jgi:hypothetical protein
MGNLERREKKLFEKNIHITNTLCISFWSFFHNIIYLSMDVGKNSFILYINLFLFSF